jgi:hypothetical protein
VRRRALDLGVDLRYVHGSGPAGRILHDDLDAYLAGGGQAPGQGASPYVERHGEEAIPVIGLRRKIAQKMQEAKRRIPHFSYVEEVDVTELEQLRQQLNKLHGATRGKLTLLPFLARAMVLALRDFPQINARFDDEAGVVTRHAAVHLGVATQTDGGLMVPVLRHAEALDLWACAGGHRARGRRRAQWQGAARGAVGLDHHPHQPGGAGRHRQHAGHQPPRGGHRRRQPHGGAAHAPQRPGGGAPADEPVVLVRPPRGRRHGRGAIHPGHARAARNPGPAVRGVKREENT